MHRLTIKTGGSSGIGKASAGGLLKSNRLTDCELSKSSGLMNFDISL